MRRQRLVAYIRCPQPSAAYETSSDLIRECAGQCPNLHLSLGAVDIREVIGQIRTRGAKFRCG